MFKSALKVAIALFAASFLALSLAFMSGCGNPKVSDRTVHNIENGTLKWDMDKNSVKPSDNVGADGDVMKPDGSIEYR